MEKVVLILTPEEFNQVKSAVFAAENDFRQKYCREFEEEKNPFYNIHIKLDAIANNTESLIAS